jgi:hypothetical protein
LPHSPPSGSEKRRASPENWRAFPLGGGGEASLSRGCPHGGVVAVVAHVVVVVVVVVVAHLVVVVVVVVRGTS